MTYKEALEKLRTIETGTSRSLSYRRWIEPSGSERDGMSIFVMLPGRHIHTGNCRSWEQAFDQLDRELHPRDPMEGAPTDKA